MDFAEKDTLGTSFVMFETWSQFLRKWLPCPVVGPETREVCKLLDEEPKLRILIAVLAIVLVYWLIRFFILRIGSRRATALVHATDATVATAKKEIEDYKRSLIVEAILVAPSVFLFWATSFAVAAVCTGLTATVWWFATRTHLDSAVLFLEFFAITFASALVIVIFRNRRQFASVISRARTWQSGGE